MANRTKKGSETETKMSIPMRDLVSLESLFQKGNGILWKKEPKALAVFQVFHWPVRMEKKETLFRSRFELL